MCESCEQTGIHIASLLDALQLGTNEAWEYSEPVCVGGPGSTAGVLYPVRAPFTGDCQFAVDFASCGATVSQILISTTRRTQGIDYTGASGGTGELTTIDGLAINLQISSTVPIASHWYNVRDSNNTIYVLIINASNAAYVNLQFRQKRAVK